MSDEFAWLCLGVLFIAQGQTSWRDDRQNLAIRWVGYSVMTALGIGSLYLSGVTR